MKRLNLEYKKSLGIRFFSKKNEGKIHDIKVYLIPIENVKKIMPYKDLVNLIIQSAKKEFDRVESSGYGKESTEYKNAFEVRNKLRLFTLSDEEKAKLSDTEKDQMK